MYGRHPKLLNIFVKVQNTPLRTEGKNKRVRHKYNYWLNVVDSSKRQMFNLNYL